MRRWMAGAALVPTPWKTIRTPWKTIRARVVSNGRCRRADDVADEVGANRALALAELDAIEADLQMALDGTPRNAIDAGLAATFRAYPGLSVDPFLDMLTGFKTDIQEDAVRFRKWEPDLRT